MGYAFCMSTCYGCKVLFSYNPNLVPSVRINGVREPVCAACVERANPQRAKNGLDQIIVQPGAYDACDEVELEY